MIDNAAVHCIMKCSMVANAPVFVSVAQLDRATAF